MKSRTLIVYGLAGDKLQRTSGRFPKLVVRFKFSQGLGVTVGIDTAAAQLILLARNYMELESKTALILGHQKNYIGPKVRREIAKHFGVSRADLSQEYADAFLRTSGIEKVDVLDISDYEGANVIHDLNVRIPGAMRKYPLVIDIGTLEHVFNINQGLENIKYLCEPDGLVLMMSPANNWLGHGFYQFSPELLFRAFDNSLGWDVKAMFIVKKSLSRTRWYEVQDPRKTRRRGNLYSNGPTYVAMIARKLRESETIMSLQQSDYVSAWDTPKLNRMGVLYLKLPRLVRMLLDVTLMALLAKYRGRLQRVKFKWGLGRLTIV
jgi:hypothetical protein